MLLTLALPFGCVGCSGGGSADGSVDSFVGGFASYEQISGAEAKALMDSESGYIILDVREQYEYDEGHMTCLIICQ